MSTPQMESDKHFVDFAARTLQQSYELMLSDKKVQIAREETQKAREETQKAREETQKKREEASIAETELKKEETELKKEECRERQKYVTMLLNKEYSSGMRSTKNTKKKRVRVASKTSTKKRRFSSAKAAAIPLSPATPHAAAKVPAAASEKDGYESDQI